MVLINEILEYLISSYIKSIHALYIQQQAIVDKNLKAELISFKYKIL